MKISLPHTPTQKNLFAYLIIALAVIFSYHKVFLLIYPLKYDFVDYFFPVRYFMGQCLSNGFLSFWLPYTDCGFAYSGDPQSGFYYPITWITGLLTGYSLKAAQIEFTLHLIFAGIGFYKLGYTFFNQRKVALILGISYALSGFFVGNSQHYSWVVSATWLPFVFNYFILANKTHNIIFICKTALAIFLMATGGYPAFYFILAYFILFYVLVKGIACLLSRKNKNLIRLIITNGKLVLLTVLLCSGYLVSIFIASRFISRADSITLEVALGHPFSPKALISLIAPFAVIKESINVFEADMSMTNAYMGLLVLISFCFSLFKRQPLKYYIILGLVLLMFGISIGNHFFLREFMYHHLPLMNLFRFPSLFRLFLITGFLLCAGYGLNKLVKNGNKISFQFIGIVIFFIISSAITVYILKEKYYIYFNEFVQNELFIFSKNSTLVQHVIFQLLIQIGFLSILIALYYKLQGKIRNLSIILLVIIDLGFAVWLNAPYNVYTNLRIKELQGFMDNFPQGFGNPTIENVKYNTDEKFKRIYFWKNVPIFFKQVSANGLNPFLKKDYKEFESDLYLKNTLTDNKLAYLSSQVYPHDMLTKHLTDSTLKPGNMYVPNQLFNTLGADEMKVFSTDSCYIINYKPNNFKINCITKQKAMLGVLQNNYPGWKAYIDGKAVKIIPVNKTFMGIAIEGGEHTIHFVFRPIYEIIGFIVSLTSLMAILAFLFIEKIKNVKPTF